MTDWQQETRGLFLWPVEGHAGGALPATASTGKGILPDRPRLSFWGWRSRAHLDGQAIVNSNDNHGKWRSGAVGQLREQATELVVAEHRVVVIRSEDHHVRMPVANTSAEVLVRRPHVSEGDPVPPRKLTHGLGRLHTLSDLIRRFSFHSQFAS